MIVNGYGIQLERLKEKDIELVREKRNSQTVAPYMHYREHITSDMQRDWYRSINNIHNLYYLIHARGEKVGLIYGAEIDWEKQETGNGGIFIWNELLWQTEVPLMANMVMLDLSVYFGLTLSRIKVLPDNLRAIRYNAQLGYQMMPGQENESNQAYLLHTETYYKNTQTLRNYLFRIHGEAFGIVIDDPGHPVTDFLVDRYKNNMPEHYRKRLNLVHP